MGYGRVPRGLVTHAHRGPAQTRLTPTQRALRAPIAANARWSREDPAANAARGQAGLLARFDREAREAEPGLTEAEYARRAQSAYRAHMGRLALASSRHAPARPAVVMRPRRRGRPGGHHSRQTGPSVEIHHDTDKLSVHGTADGAP